MCVHVRAFSTLYVVSMVSFGRKYLIEHHQFNPINMCSLLKTTEICFSVQTLMKFENIRKLYKLNT
jgi:hypothetical protein